MPGWAAKWRAMTEPIAPHPMSRIRGWEELIVSTLGGGEKGGGITLPGGTGDR